MPHPCVVCGRSRMNPNNREEDYMFFGFPVNDEVRCKKWLEFCCREDLYKLTKKQLLQRMVCSKHFERRYFLNEYFDRLNCTAIPSIYDPKQSLYNVTCVLCGRTRRDPPDLNYDGATFHHFPGEEFRCLKWLDFVGVESYYRLTRKEILYCYICSKHFDRSQFLRGYKNRLVDYAVPNIRCPDESNEPEEYIMEPSSESKLLDSSSNKKLEPLPSDVLESQACAACGRSRSDPRNKLERYKFHPFPAYEIGRCLRWCQFLGREDLLKMSPNQIRKLVLCSKHFQIGQSFHRVGPCDAVPTIRDVTDDMPIEILDEVVTEDLNSMVADDTTLKKVNYVRPMVSSKKPKIANKPSPLAKKRGKSKRPTSINIPSPDPNNLETRLIRKLPLPSANHWKLQIQQGMQPITIGSNITAATTDGKKVILPFTGDISNLGSPIPVDSLSSMPPGLLIKINLPDQKKSPRKRRTPNICHTEQLTSNNIQFLQCTSSTLKNGHILSGVQKSDDEKEEVDVSDSNFTELLEFEPEDVQTETLHNDEMDVQEEIILSDPLHIKHEDIVVDNEDIVADNEDGKEEYYYEELPHEEVVYAHKRRLGRRRAMSALARKTILPLKSKIRFFLRQIAPRIQRLPKKARAQLKLSFVNMVIDHL